MKTVFLLISLVALIFGEVTYNSYLCSYETSNGEVSLSSFGGFINTSLANGQRWFVNPCPHKVYSNSPCPVGSDICVAEADSETVSRGDSYTALYADSSSGQGVEIMMSSEGCSEGGNYKATVELVCVNSATTWLVQSEGCAVTINILTSAACVDDQDSSSTIPYYDNQPIVVHEHIVLLPAIIVLAVALCSFLLCCCCAARRRRRCQMAKRIQMEQFSNVAFRPIPSNQATRAPEETAPFNPYVAQPQYFYYYPTQQEQAQAQAPEQVQLDTQTQDEKMAKELQAQYDQESQL